jgi:hypothetical protein
LDLELEEKKIFIVNLTYIKPLEEVEKYLSESTKKYCIEITSRKQLKELGVVL